MNISRAAASMSGATALGDEARDSRSVEDASKKVVSSVS